MGNRIIELIAQLKAVIWELDNMPMSKEVTCWNEELEKADKELNRIWKSYKNYGN